MGDNTTGANNICADILMRKINVFDVDLNVKVRYMS
jgi:hypothetical protein